jgi:cytosine permease
MGKSHVDIVEEYAGEPLPERLTVSGWRVALVVGCFTISLPTFLNGAEIALSIGLVPAVLAAVGAGAILALGGSITSIVSVRTRLNTYLLIQRSFGLGGAGLVNVVMAIIHFAWFGVNVSFFGGAMVAATESGYGVAGSFPLLVLLGTLLMTVTTIFGFRLINRIALFTVPFLAAILIVVAISATSRNGIVFDPPALGLGAITFGIALSSLIGADMLTVTAMPDLSRYTRTRAGAITSMILSFPVFAPIVMTAAALSALAMGGSDIMRMITGLGLGLPALALLIISTWTINVLNLYSASLALAATFPSVSRTWFIVLGGFVGAGFALAGIIDSFIPFLIILGLVIPPIAAIYVIDSFTRFRNVDSAKTIENLPVMRWPAVAIWIAAALVALFAHFREISLTGVPAFDATLGAALAYWAVRRFSDRRVTQ